MNIHEYQAKAVLAKFGVPVPRGFPAFSVEEAVKRREGARRPGLGREGADPRRRPRQGPAASRSVQVASRTSRRRRTRLLGSTLVTHPDRPEGQAGQPASMSRKARRSRRSSISRCWSTASPRASRSSSRPKAAWTSRRSRTTRRRRSSPSRSIRSTGHLPHHVRAPSPRRSASMPISPSR